MEATANSLFVKLGAVTPTNPISTGVPAGAPVALSWAGPTKGLAESPQAEGAAAAPAVPRYCLRVLKLVWLMPGIPARVAYPAEVGAQADRKSTRLNSS